MRGANTILQGELAAADSEQHGVRAEAGMPRSRVA